MCLAHTLTNIYIYTHTQEEAKKKDHEKWDARASQIIVEEEKEEKEEEKDEKALDTSPSTGKEVKTNTKDDKEFESFKSVISETEMLNQTKKKGNTKDDKEFESFKSVISETEMLNQTKKKGKKPRPPPTKARDDLSDHTEFESADDDLNEMLKRTKTQETSIYERLLLKFTSVLITSLWFIMALSNSFNVLTLLNLIFTTYILLNRETFRALPVEKRSKQVFKVFIVLNWLVLFLHVLYQTPLFDDDDMYCIPGTLKNDDGDPCLSLGLVFGLHKFYGYVALPLAYENV